jgi:hypothetical protein
VFYWWTPLGMILSLAGQHDHYRVNVHGHLVGNNTGTSPGVDYRRLTVLP